MKCASGFRLSIGQPIYIKALANEDTVIVSDTLLPTHMFPRLPARATFVADTKNVSDFVQNILCPEQMFPSLRNPRNIMSSNVSATVCPRLRGPLGTLYAKRPATLLHVSREIHVIFFVGKPNFTSFDSLYGTSRFLYHSMRSSLYDLHTHIKKKNKLYFGTSIL